MKHIAKFGVVLVLFSALAGCALADAASSAASSVASKISRAVPKSISIKIPSNMLNSASGAGGATPASLDGTTNVGPAYNFLKEYVTLANTADLRVDAVISNINANTNYLFQTNVMGHAFTNSAGTEWYYFNTNGSANYVYVGDVTNNSINTNFYMDWAGAQDQFTGKAIFYANDPAADMQEATLLFDYSKAQPTLDVYIKFKSYFTNFRVLITSLSNGKISVKAKILGDSPTNTVTPNSWVDTWEIVGYGQTNAPGGAKAWISGTYSNSIATNYVSTNTSYPPLGGLELTVVYTNIQTASVYDYEEYFSTGGTTEWKMGSANITGPFLSSYGDFYTNVSNGEHDPWAYGNANYGYDTNYNMDFTATNYEDTYPVIIAGADITTSTNMDGSTNYTTNTIYYENTNTKPYPAVESELDNLSRITDATYPNNTLYSM